MALKKSQKSLKKWTSQKWDYLSKGDKDKPKKKASKTGKQKASYSKSVRKKMRGK